MGQAEPALCFDRAAYFDWEAHQAGKNEYWGGDIYAMVGARQEHVLVTLALASRLREHLRGTPCRTYASDMKLEVEAADAVFYPDVMVSGDAADRQAPIALRAPCLLVAVLSDSTAAIDRGRKFAAYRKVSALREYLLVDIDARRLELFRLETAGWVLHEPAGEPSVLRLESIGLDLTPHDAFGDLNIAAPGTSEPEIPHA